MDGGALTQAGVGQPFMAYVTVHEAHNVMTRPTLHHSNDITVRANGYQMNMINGSTTIVYQFQVRIDTPGTFTIGPARLTHESNTIESNAISVLVTAEQKVDQLKKASTSATTHFFRLSTDKQRAYVGEKITCTLTFYTNDNNVSLQAIYDPDQLEKIGFKCKSKSEPVNGVTVLEGTEYRYAQWEFQAYATKAGNLILPAYAVDFICQTNRGMFAMLFAHHDVKRIYSNTVNLSIDPLPTGKRTPSFVGTISQFNAKITPAHTQVANGMTLTLSITGQGDFDTIPFIPLNRMDESFKWYESKQSMQQAKDGENTHVMEYVVQATQPGTYAIPNQEFFYFDTKERTFKLIKTLEIPIHITPGTATRPLPTTTHVQQTQATSASTDMVSQKYESPSPYYIPWSIYWGAIIMMVILAIAWNLYCVVPRLGWQPKNPSIKKFKKQIFEISKLHHYQSLYPLFTTICAQKIDIKAEQITEDDITLWLSHAGLTSELLHEWKNFFQELAQLRFGHKKGDNPKDLIKRALYWLDILDKVPGGNR